MAYERPASERPRITAHLKTSSSGGLVTRTWMFADAGILPRLRRRVRGRPALTRLYFETVTFAEIPAASSLARTFTASSRVANGPTRTKYSEL